MKLGVLFRGLLPFAAIVALRGMGGCPQAPAVPRSTARSVVFALGEGLQRADAACAALVGKASGSRDAAEIDRAIAIAKSCDAAYTSGRSALLATEGSIDAPDSARSWSCSASAALSAMRALGDVVRGAGGSVPSAVDDVEAFAAPLVGAACSASGGGV